MILQYVAAGNWGQATKIAYESPHPVARVLYAGIESKHHAPGMAMEAAALFRAKVERLTERMEEQATRLEHFLSRREE